MSDENEALFTITKAHLNTGLRGFPVGTVRTSFVDPYEGLHYVGYPVSQVWSLDPEAAVYLLLNKELPDAAQLAAFKADLVARSAVDPAVLASLGNLPKQGHPMEWLIAGLNLLGMTGKTGSYTEDGLNVIARLPTLVAAIYRMRSGWGEPIESKPELGLIENFVHMLGVPGADADKLTRLLRVFYVLHLDHGGGNLSTFTGKAVASGLADMYASLGAAMAGLYGPRHGRANQDCLNFLKTIGTSDPDEVEQFVRDALANKQLIYGFGHAVLRAEDARATVQYGLGQEICPDDELFKTALAMRERAVKVLKENPKVSNPYPNVDAVSGTLLQAVGLEDSDYYTVLFGLSRCSGIVAQIIDERENFRGGKGVAIYRCSYKAEGQPRRDYKG
ncbi:MAG: citrate (Si)-synthase [Alphaproteobacteria bacterium]|nr:citrate (Si)-synthase [Alphaproteobacteria bacterium]